MSTKEPWNLTVILVIVFLWDIIKSQSVPEKGGFDVQNGPKYPPDFTDAAIIHPRKKKKSSLMHQ